MKRLKTTLLLFGFLTCFLLSSCGAATRDTAASLEGKTPVSPAFTAETSGSESELSAASKEVTSPDPSASSLPSSSFSSPSGSPSGTTEPTEPAVEKFTLGFTGDVCFAENYKIYQLAKKNNRELLNCFSPTLLEQLQAVDFLTVNCESSVSNRGAALAGKGYTFRTSVATAKVFKEMGADLIGLANNHVYDFGKDAFLDTLDAFSEMNLPTVGAGRNAEEAYAPYILEKNGIKVAFVATSRAEKQYFTPVAEGENPGISGCYVLTRACSAIEVAKAQADFVIVYAHFGYEYNTVIEPAQQQAAYAFIDAGADLVVGAHPHILQGIEAYKGKMVFYSLGNFLFNDKDLDTVLLKVTLEGKDRVSYNLVPCRQTGGVVSDCGGTVEGERILQALRRLSIGIAVDREGNVYNAEAEESYEKIKFRREEKHEHLYFWRSLRRGGRPLYPGNRRGLPQIGAKGAYADFRRRKRRHDGSGGQRLPGGRREDCRRGAGILSCGRRAL